MEHQEKEQIREDIELLQQTLQGTEDEYSDDEDDDGNPLFMDVDSIHDEDGNHEEIGSMVSEGISGAQLSVTEGRTESPITVFSEDETESQFSRPDRPSSVLSEYADDMEYVVPSSGENSLLQDPETCLALNRAYQELVSDNLQKIETMLTQNRARQAAIHENMDIATLNAKESAVPKKHQLLKYTMPYFKDSAASVPQPNADVLLKRSLGEPDLPRARLRAFIKKDRDRMVAAVQEDNLRRWLQPLMNKLEIQQEKLLKILDPKKEGEIKKEIKSINKEIENIKALSDIEKAGTFEDAEKVDWMKISTVDFELRSPADIKQAWLTSIHPGINHGKWTVEEEKKIVELVEDMPEGGWEAIAFILGTKRTPIQCFQHYQQKLNQNYGANVPFTEAEDEMLIKVVKSLTFNGPVSNWQQVAAFMEGRTERECYMRHKKVDPDLIRGKWTPEEDDKLLSGVRLLGPKDWFKFWDIVPGRNAAQCRERWYNNLTLNLKVGAWSYEEDKTLFLKYQKYPGQWTKIAEFLPGRTDSVCLKRYRKMLKWKEIAENEAKTLRRRGGAIYNRGKAYANDNASYNQLLRLASRVFDKQTETKMDYELIQEDKRNNIFIPRPPSGAVRYGVVNRMLEQRSRVERSMLNKMNNTSSTSTNVRKTDPLDEKMIDSQTLTKYLAKRSDVLCPAIVIRLKEIITEGKPLSIRQVLTLSKNLKKAASGVTRFPASNKQKVEDELAVYIQRRIPIVVRRGRPRNIWKTLNSRNSRIGKKYPVSEEEDTKNKIALLLMNAFGLETSQLLKRAMALKSQREAEERSESPGNGMAEHPGAINHDDLPQCRTLDRTSPERTCSEGAANEGAADEEGALIGEIVEPVVAQAGVGSVTNEGCSKALNVKSDLKSSEGVVVNEKSTTLGNQEGAVKKSKSAAVLSKKGDRGDSDIGQANVDGAENNQDGMNLGNIEQDLLFLRQVSIDRLDPISENPELFSPLYSSATQETDSSEKPSGPLPKKNDHVYSLASLPPTTTTLQAFRGLLLDRRRLQNKVRNGNILMKRKAEYMSSRADNEDRTPNDDFLLKQFGAPPVKRNYRKYGSKEMASYILDAQNELKLGLESMMETENSPALGRRRATPNNLGEQEGHIGGGDHASNAQAVQEVEKDIMNHLSLKKIDEPDGLEKDTNDGSPGTGEPSPGLSSFSADVTTEKVAKKPENLKDIVDNLHNTHDYQMLRARFCSLFIWPALLSATQVPAVRTNPVVQEAAKPKATHNPRNESQGEVADVKIYPKKKKYACTGGAKSRRYKFLSKEKKKIWEEKHAQHANFMRKKYEGKKKSDAKNWCPAMPVVKEEEDMSLGIETIIKVEIKEEEGALSPGMETVPKVEILEEDGAFDN